MTDFGLGDEIVNDNVLRSMLKHHGLSVLTTEGASHTDLAGEQRYNSRVGADLSAVTPCTHNGESRPKA